MNKKLLLVAGVLSVISVNVMAENFPDNHYLAFKQINNEKPRTYNTEILGGSIQVNNNTIGKTDSMMTGITSQEFLIRRSKDGADITPNATVIAYKDVLSLDINGLKLYGHDENNKYYDLSFNNKRISVNNQKIENVKDGENAKDAVNVSQLNYAISKVEDKIIEYSSSDSNIRITPDPEDIDNKNKKISLNTNLTSMNSATFGYSNDSGMTTINRKKAQFFDGDVNTAITANGTKLENTNNLDTAEYTMDGMQANSNGKFVRFGTLGINAGNQQIHDVAKGTADTDAVNVKQLKDYVNDKRTIVQAGDNITVTEDSGTYTVSTAKDLTDMNSINLNDGNSESHYTVKGVDMTYRGDFEYHTQYNYDGMHIKINDGDTQSINNEVSVTDKGLNNGNNKIINVSRGENDTDAVNVSQLKETNKKVDDNTKVIENHESRITDLEHKTVDVGRNALERANHYTDLQVNKGVAKASALAGLKFLDYNPKDKWSFAASVGHYRNANAVAVGAAYQPNENTMIHSGITVDGKVAYNLGVSVKTGGQKYINKYELAEQVKQLQSDNALLREELNELRSMIEKK